MNTEVIEFRYGVVFSNKESRDKVRKFFYKESVKNDRSVAEELEAVVDWYEKNRSQ